MCFGDNVLLSYKYGIMAIEKGKVYSYHAKNIKQLHDIMINIFMGKAVTIWTNNTEININIEKDGLFWPSWEKTNIKTVSKILNRKEE